MLSFKYLTKIKVIIEYSKQQHKKKALFLKDFFKNTLNRVGEGGKGLGHG